MTTFKNYYHCPCGTEWTDIWDCACNDRCPACNKEIEPYKSELPDLQEILQLPWSHDENGLIYGGPSENDADESLFIADTIKDNLSSIANDIEVERAEFIVRACNSHEDLVNALKGIIWKLSHNWDDGKPARITRDDATVRQAVEALTKAVGVL